MWFLNPSKGLFKKSSEKDKRPHRIFFPVSSVSWLPSISRKQSTNTFCLRSCGCCCPLITGPGWTRQHGQLPTHPRHSPGAHQQSDVRARHQSHHDLIRKWHHLCGLYQRDTKAGAFYLELEAGNWHESGVLYTSYLLVRISETFKMNAFNCCPYPLIYNLMLSAEDWGQEHTGGVTSLRSGWHWPDFKNQFSLHLNLIKWTSLLGKCFIHVTHPLNHPEPELLRKTSSSCFFLKLDRELVLLKWVVRLPVIHSGSFEQTRL